MAKMIKATEQYIAGSGQHWEYKAPTHWTNICLVFPDGHLQWGSGGTNDGFTSIEIAEALIQAFTMAKERLIQIENKEIG